MADKPIPKELEERMDQIAKERDEQARKDQEQAAENGAAQDKAPKKPGSLRRILADSFNVGTNSYYEQMSDYNKYVSEHPEQAADTVTTDAEAAVAEEASEVESALQKDEAELDAMATKGNIDEATAEKTKRVIDALIEEAERDAANIVAEVKKPGLWDKLKDNLKKTAEQLKKTPDDGSHVSEAYNRLSGDDEEIFDSIKLFTGDDVKIKRKVIDYLKDNPGKTISENLRDWLGDPSYLPTNAEIQNPDLIGTNQPIENSETREAKRLDAIKDALVNEYAEKIQKRIRKNIELLGVKRQRISKADGVVQDVTIDTIIEEIATEIVDLESDTAAQILNNAGHVDTRDVEAIMKNGFSDEQKSKATDALKVLLEEAHEKKAALERASELTDGTKPELADGPGTETHAKTQEAKTADPEIAGQMEKLSSYLPAKYQDTPLGKLITNSARMLIHSWNIADNKDHFQDPHQLQEAMKQALEKYKPEDLDMDDGEIVPDMGGLNMPETAPMDSAPVTSIENKPKAETAEQKIVKEQLAKLLKLIPANNKFKNLIAAEARKLIDTWNRADSTDYFSDQKQLKEAVKQATQTIEAQAAKVGEVSNEVPDIFGETEDDDEVTAQPETKTENIAGWNAKENTLTLDNGTKINLTKFGLTAKNIPDAGVNTTKLAINGKDGSTIFTLGIRKESNGNFTIFTKKGSENESGVVSGDSEDNIPADKLKGKIETQIEEILNKGASEDVSSAAA